MIICQQKENRHEILILVNKFSKNLKKLKKRKKLT